MPRKGRAYSTNSVNYFDENERVVSWDEAVRIVKSRDQFIIKPSFDSGLGRGVSLETRDSDIPKLLEDYKTDFVIQDVVRQHRDIAKYSKRSVNVFRIMTIMLNGTSRFLSATLRFNEADVPNDNYVSRDGRGLVVVGVDSNGNLDGKRYYPCGVAIEETACGRFAGERVSFFEKMRDLVVELQGKLGHFGFVGWDVAVDEKGEPVILEYNIKSPGVLFYQYANGPLFQGYTREVVDTFL